MKKLLALVLALVMTLGLATVSTSAAYTDANDIDYTEAVDVMTAVGVFQGKGDAFAPKDGLNRAEAAKLVAYLMLGNKTAESMKGSGTRFTDIPASHWASGYVEYLASVGVVSGVGNGQFNPNGQVTAVQFAKMLLVALGYDAELENFVGEGWSINIQKVANENDLFKGLDINANDAVTREQAAQMCLNDLKADEVEYVDKGTTVKIGESTVVTGAKNATKKVATGTKATAIDDTNIIGGKSFQLGEDLYSGDLTLTKDGHDDMGRPANKWKYKTADVGTYAATDDIVFEAQDEVKRNKVYEVLGSTAADDLLKTTPSANEFVIWVDGFDMTKYFDASDLMDKNNSSGIGAAAPTKKDGTVAGQGTQFTGNGSTTQIYLDDSGAKDKYTFVIVNEYLVQATADYSTSREEVNVKLVTDDATAQPWYWTLPAKPGTGDTVYYQTIENVIKQEDFDVSGVKKDDYLIVTYSAKEDSFQSVKPATMLEGEITKYVSNDTVTIDGTLYKYAKKVNSDDKATTYSVGNKVVMVTDGKYILAVDDANATKDYVYLQDVGKSTGTSSNVAVALYGTDGVLRDVKVKKITSAADDEYNGKKLDFLAQSSTNKDPDTNATETDLYGWYTYSVDDSGVYTLKAVDKTNLSNTNYTYTTLSYDTAKTSKLKVVDGDKVSFLKNEAGTTQSIKANSKTVFIVLDNDDDITVYTGLDNAPTITLDNDSSTAAYISYVNDDGYATYVFVDLSDTTSKTAIIDDSTLSDDYIMVVKSNKGKDNYETKDNGNVYYSNTVLFDGGITTKTFEQTTSATTGVLYHKIKTNSKGYITGLTAITDESTKDYAYNTTADNSLTSPITFKNGTVTIGGNGYLLNSNDCVYLVLAKGSAPAQDKNKDFTEYLKIGGAALESYLKGYSFDYRYYGVRHDDNSSTLDALYVWALNTTSVNSLSEFKDPSDNDTYFFSGDVKMDKGVTLNSGATIYVDGKLDTNGQTLTISNGTKLYVNSITGADGSVALSGGGELYVDGTLETGSITVTGCKLDVANGVKVKNAIKITGKDGDPAQITFGGKVEAKSVELNAFSKVSFENGVKTTEDFKATNAIDVAVAGTAEVGGNVSVTGSKVAFKGTTTATNVTITDSAVTVEDTMTVAKAFTATTSSGETTLNLGANVAAETVTVDGSTTVAKTEDAEDVSIEGSKATTIDESVKVEDVEVVDGIDTARESALKLVEATAKAYTDALTAKEVETKDALAKDITNAATALTNAISKAETAKAIEDLVAEDSTTSAGTAFWNAIKAAGTAISKKVVAPITTVASRARWSDGGEVFTQDPTTNPNWSYVLGKDLAQPTAEIDEKGYAYDAENNVSYATVKVTLADEKAMVRHYNAAGEQGYWYGLSLAKVDGAKYALTTDTEADVKKLTYKDAHWTGDETVSMYPNVTDTTTKFMLVVKVGNAYTAYVLDFSGVANGKDYKFDFEKTDSKVKDAWSRLTSEGNKVTKIWENGKAVATAETPTETPTTPDTPTP